MIFALFVISFVCLIGSIFSQTEKLDIVEFAPPTGWAKTPKEGVMTFTDQNKATAAFCILSVYASLPTSGDAQKDFDNVWNVVVVKSFKADANPKTETRTQDGWTSVSGAAQIETDGVRSAVVMTVITGYGRTASVFAIFNNEAYVAPVDTFMTSIKMDKIKAQAFAKPPAESSPAAAPANSQNAEYLDFDPFPDKPYIQAQKPLFGRVRKSITAADLAGTWEIGGASVMTYVSSSTQQYTSASFFGKKYFIKADSTYESRTQARASNTTIRETDSGSFILAGATVTMKSVKNPAMRYQFIAYMVQPNGAAVLTLVYIGDGAPMDTNAQIANCSHPNGYVTCLNGEEWVRIP